MLEDRRGEVRWKVEKGGGKRRGVDKKAKRIRPG
jgi:hypothetical protein